MWNQSVPDVVSWSNEYPERGQLLDNLWQLKESIEGYNESGEAPQQIEVVGKVGQLVGVKQERGQTLAEGVCAWYVIGFEKRG